MRLFRSAKKRQSYKDLYTGQPEKTRVDNHLVIRLCDPTNNFPCDYNHFLHMPKDEALDLAKFITENFKDE